MNSKTAVNIIGILFLYAVWAAIIHVLPADALGPRGDQRPEDFVALFQQNALLVLKVSFGCMVVWFALGEWLLSAWTEYRTLILSWFGLLVIIVGTAVYMSYLGPKGGATDPANYTVPCYYILGGILSFYIPCVCFSPSNVKYSIWPAKRIRRW